MAGVVLPDRVVSAHEHTDHLKELIARVRTNLAEFWYILRDFHANREWHDLGYRTFEDYLNKELGISKQRAYQLLDAAGVRDSLIADPQNVNVVDHPHNVDHLTESQARVLKPLSPPERRKVVEGVDFAKLSVAELKKLALERTHRAQVERFEIPQPTQALALLEPPVIRVESPRRLEAPQPTIVRYGRPVVTLDTTLGELRDLLLEKRRFDEDLEDRSLFEQYFARD